MIPARWDRPDTGGDDRGGAEVLFLSSSNASDLLIMGRMVNIAYKSLEQTQVKSKEQVRLCGA